MGGHVEELGYHQIKHYLGKELLFFLGLLALVIMVGVRGHNYL
jgi:hypothetical protein